MVELVDTLDSKSSERKFVWVRVPPSVLIGFQVVTFFVATFFVLNTSATLSAPPRFFQDLIFKIFRYAANNAPLVCGYENLTFQAIYSFLLYCFRKSPLRGFRGFHTPHSHCQNAQFSHHSAFSP